MQTPLTNTTPERVRAIASHLKRLNNDVLRMYIEDAARDLQRYASSPRFTQNRERLQRYLAAHLATIDKSRATSERADGLSLSFHRPQGSDLNSTEYGQEVLRILRTMSQPISSL